MKNKIITCVLVLTFILSFAGSCAPNPTPDNRNHQRTAIKVHIKQLAREYDQTGPFYDKIEGYLNRVKSPTFEKYTIYYRPTIVECGLHAITLYFRNSKTDSLDMEVTFFTDGSMQSKQNLAAPAM